MAVLRINKTNDYTVMSNVHLRDKSLSLKAKGLLSLMLSLPDEWDYSVNGLVAICKESKKAVTAALTELQELGYLVITKKMPNETDTGRYEYIYDIFEEPQETEPNNEEFCEETEKQDTQKQGLEKQGLEKVPQLNTNNKILNNKNNKKKNIKKKKPTEYDDILSAIDDEKLRDAYLDYIEMRKLIKSPMTARALEMLINKVNTLEPDNIERQKLLLATAIINNWKSVYPLKDGQASPRNEPTRYGGTYI